MAKEFMWDTDKSIRVRVSGIKHFIITPCYGSKDFQVRAFTAAFPAGIQVCYGTKIDCQDWVTANTRS